MLRKLLKYDLRSTLRQFAFVWPAALVVAVINRFTLPVMDSGGSLGELASVISVLLYMAVLVAMVALTLVIVIQRFYRGLLGDEGYLMHTLPVKSWQLVASKLICAVAVVAVSVLVGIASVMLLIPASAAQLRQFWGELTEVLLSPLWSDLGIRLPLLLLEVLLVCCLQLVQALLHLYLAMAVGHFARRNRLAMSVAAYVVIAAVVSAVSGMVGDRMMLAVSSAEMQTTNEILAAGVRAVQQILLPSAALDLLLAVIFFLATNYILSRKLNLE